MVNLSLPKTKQIKEFKERFMRNFKKVLVTLAIAVFAVMIPKTQAKAANAALPASTPVWFDAEYYATVYPDVYNAFAPNIQAMGGLDNAMWFHYKNLGVNEGRKPAADPNWFDAAYYAATYPDVAAVYGNDADKLFAHYITLGRSELRRPNASYVHTMDRNGVPNGLAPSAPAPSVPAPTTASGNTPSAQAPASVQVSGGIPAIECNIYVPTGVAFNGSPYYIMVDRTYNVCNVLTVGADGTYSQLIRSMACSTGRAGHSTPAGTFRIYEHTAGGGWVYMADGTWAVWGMRFRTGGYMFHSVCFEKKGDLLPIPEEVAALGSKASLGCVRLSVEDAMWLYNTVPDGTLVTIAG